MSLKPFAMPKWGIEMSEGTLAGWQVEEGEPFAKGQVLALIETDKITNEIEAEVDGCLVRLVASEQQTLPVGALLAVLGPPGTSPEDIDAFIAAFKPAGGGAADDAEEKEDADATSGEAPAAPPTPTKRERPATRIAQGVAISPAARRTAEAAGLAVADITATGRGGRITRQDVDKALAGKRAPVLTGPIEAPGQEQAFASPLARRLAVLNQLDLAAIEGTGPKGRVCKADVLALIEQSAAGDTPRSRAPEQPSAGKPSPGRGEVEIVPMSAMRRAIARRLSAAKQTIPHIYLRRRVRADRLIAMRELAGKPGTINDYLLRACALALREVPAVNVQVHNDAIHRFARADIAIAVATERGLITPIIEAADTLGVADIASRASALAQRARAGKLRPEEFEGGSFSISNLGAFGVESFDAVVNPPQGAILAVGAAAPEPYADDGALRIVPVLHLSLSCDHRAIDGIDGARFLEALAGLIEQPEQLAG